jgi:hypothetical protein
MSKLEMLIYTAFDGVEATVAWKDEKEYQNVRRFLEDKGVRVSGISSGNQPMEGNFVYIENERQLEELFEYARSLRENGS